MHIIKTHTKQQRDIVINPSDHLPVISSHHPERLEKTKQKKNKNKKKKKKKKKTVFSGTDDDVFVLHFDILVLNIYAILAK